MRDSNASFFLFIQRIALFGTAIFQALNDLFCVKRLQQYLTGLFGFQRLEIPPVTFSMQNELLVHLEK